MSAKRTPDQLEDQLFAALEASAQALPPIHRLVASSFLERVRELIAARRALELERARYYAELFARVEALEADARLRARIRFPEAES